MDVVRCPGCGEENPSRFRLCGYCGTSLTLPVVASVSCPACGSENPAGFRFCGFCGTVLDPQAAGPGGPPGDPMHGGHPGAPGYGLPPWAWWAVRWAPPWSPPGAYGTPTPPGLAGAAGRLGHAASRLGSAASGLGSAATRLGPPALRSPGTRSPAIRRPGIRRRAGAHPSRSPAIRRPAGAPRRPDGGSPAAGTPPAGSPPAGWAPPAAQPPAGWAPPADAAARATAPDAADPPTAAPVIEPPIAAPPPPPAASRSSDDAGRTGADACGDPGLASAARAAAVAASLRAAVARRRSTARRTAPPPGRRTPQPAPAEAGRARVGDARRVPGLRGASPRAAALPSQEIRKVVTIIFSDLQGQHRADREDRRRGDQRGQGALLHVDGGRDHAPRRQDREVHRRRDHGRVRPAARPRGRCAARGPRGPRHDQAAAID